MTNAVTIGLDRLRAVGIPVGSLPEDPPRRDGCALFALITSSTSTEFTVAVHDASTYRTYRTMTNHPDDQGSWFFLKMELFFVPEGLIASG